MKFLQIILLIIFVQCVLSCKRPHPTACFTISKPIANVGDTIIFTNCSDYDGGSTYTKWHFGDTIIINNGGNVQHVYNIAGQYVVDLTVGGEKTHCDNIGKTITIQ